MNRRTTRWTHLAIACGAVALLTAGCDNSENALLDQQANAIAVRKGGGSGAEVSKELSGATDGSLPVNIQANQLVAQSRLSDARSLASKLTAKQSAAEDLVSRIGSLGSMANLASTLSTSYRQQEPSASLSLIKELSTKVRGDGNVEKFSDLPNGSIPTLAAVKQEKSRLEGELAKAQNDLRSATSQRDTLLSQVGTLSSKADQQSGQAKLDTVTEAAKLRQQAAVIARGVSDLELRISQLEADLDVQKSLETNLDAALKSFEAQQQSLSSGWSATSEKINQQSKLASSILVNASTEGPESTVASLAAQLNAVLKDADQLREETLSAYSDAVSKFTAAESGSNGLKQSLSDTGGKASAEAPALNSLAATLNADRFNLEKSIALREQAGVHSSYARLLLHMASVAASLESLPETLNAPTPDPFNSEKLKASATEAVKNADQLLLEAKDKVEGVSLTDENLASLRPLKASTGIFVSYDRALLSGLASSAKIDADVAKATVYEDSIKTAKDLIGSARESSIVVPNVPSEIYVAPPKPVEEKPAEAAAPAAEPDSPVVAELRQSLKDALTQAAAAKEDPSAIDGLFNRVKTDEITQPLVAEVREMIDLQLKVHTAVKNKWGDEGVAELQKLQAEQSGAGEMNPEAVAKRIDTLKLAAVDDTHIESPMPFPGENAPKIKFVKEEDVWKVDLTGMPEGFKVLIGAATGAMKPMKDKLTQLAADIDAGKYENVEAVKTAISEMLPKAPGAGATVPATEGEPGAPRRPEETPPDQQLMPDEKPGTGAGAEAPANPQ